MALSVILHNYGDEAEMSEFSLSEREDLSVQKILSENLEDKGLNPVSLNPATDPPQSSHSATLSST